MDKDNICNLDVALVENVIAATRSFLEAAGVGDGEVSSDGSCSVVVVADPVVVAAAAVQVALHCVPLVGNVFFNVIPTNNLMALILFVLVLKSGKWHSLI